jgi:hypothetical protein
MDFQGGPPAVVLLPSLIPHAILPCPPIVREDGVVVAAHRSNRNPAFDAGLIPIQNISYGVQVGGGAAQTYFMGWRGVRGPTNRTRLCASCFLCPQDVRFTRVVAFIVVTDNVEANKTDCDCFVYLCDSKLTARKVAFALAKAFKVATGSGGESIQNQIHNIL